MEFSLIDVSNPEDVSTVKVRTVLNGKATAFRVPFSFLRKADGGWYVEFEIPEIAKGGDGMWAEVSISAKDQEGMR